MSTASTIWAYEINPADIPLTPRRSYRLYSSDDAPLVGYYSLDNGQFQHEGTGPHGETFGASAIQEEIAAYNSAGFAPVTLRALTAPAAQHKETGGQIHGNW